MLEIVEGEAFECSGAPRLMQSLRLLYVLGAGQHGFGWQDKSRDCYPAYTADWTKA